MSARLQEDGSLLFPRRGPPPTLIDGFTRDPGDPYILRPDFESCKHRCIVKFLMPCGKLGGRHWCNLKGIEAKVDVCNFCEEIEWQGESLKTET